MTNDRTARRRRKGGASSASAADSTTEKLSFPIVRARVTRRHGEDEAAGDEVADKTLAMIHELAALQFDPKDIAIVVQIDPADMTGRDADCTTAYNSGRLLAEARVRATVLKLAEAGSQPAQTMILKMAAENKRKAEGETSADPSAAEIAAIRQHLCGLKLAAATTPTTELARLAALRIIELEGKVSHVR